jgi:hypothetical protein
MRLSNLILLLIITSTLLACSTIELLPTPPPPRPLFIGITPSLFPNYQEAIVECGNGFPDLASIIDVLPAQALDLNRSDIIIQLGEPSEITNRVLVQIGTEDLVVITAGISESESITVNELRKIYTSKTPDIQIWTYPENQEIRKLFDRIVLGEKTESPYGQIVPGPEQMLIEIKRNPGSLGYILHTWITDDVSTFELDSQVNITLQQPVIAQAKKDADKKILNFLGCLQNQWEN